MNETTASLVLRFRPAGSLTPDMYGVDANLNNTNYLSASLPIPLAELGALEHNEWEYGRRLGECIFSDTTLRRALNFARGAGATRVSVQIEIDPAVGELEGLLWERLILPEGDGLPLAVNAGFALSRRIASETPFRAGGGIFRLLVVVASPAELRNFRDESTLAWIDATKEIANLRPAWDGLVQRGLMRITILAAVEEPLKAELIALGYRVGVPPVSLAAISNAIGAFDSLHLICHGSFTNGSAHLLLEDSDGKRCIVGEAEFLPRLGTGALRLVFLQACKSATRQPGRTNVYCGLAPKLALRAGAVVAMQDFVLMEDASRFAQEFYEVLLETGSAARAANAGRLALYRPDKMNWAIPTLFLAPNADPLWQPDQVLALSQELAARLRTRTEVTAPFPIEVIRQTPGASSQMETSPPGPRMPAPDAVAELLFPPQGEASRVVVLAGNYGRGKTAQMYRMYVDYAAKVSQGGPLPFFARASDFDLTDMPPVEAVARAIVRTYWDVAEIKVPVSELAQRLSQPFILFLEGALDTDARKRLTALQVTGDLLKENQRAVAVLSLNEQNIAEAQLLAPDAAVLPVLLVQLLTPASVSRYLSGLKNGSGTKLLQAITHSNLFDIASVPWLLASLVRQSNRDTLSRSGVIARIVDNNLAAIEWSTGARRIVSDVLGRIAWIMQTDRLRHLSGSRVYEVLAEVRGKREMPLDDLLDQALATKIVCACDEDGIRFAYPGFQSYWCTQYLLKRDDSLGRALDDITASLGSRSRIRLWEDTLVLLAGLMGDPARLVRRIVTGSNPGQGEQVFLSATCIHEARLAGYTVSDDLVSQVFDLLVWRSTPAKQGSASVRSHAIQCLGLLRDPMAIPHLVSLALEKVRKPAGEEPTFEFSGVRLAAIQVLLSMRKEAQEYLATVFRAKNPASMTSVPSLIEAWLAGDYSKIKDIFCRNEEGIPAIAAFAMVTVGGETSLDFLAEALRHPTAAEDTVWAIADALLALNPVAVTHRAIKPAYDCPRLHPLFAYMIGKLQIAKQEDDEVKFLMACLRSGDAKCQGMALRALAQLGNDSQRRTCELLATEQWDAGAIGLPVGESAADRSTLRFYALESLRLIGTVESANLLRLARSSRGQDWEDSFVALGYEVTEDIYSRYAGSPGMAL